MATNTHRHPLATRSYTAFASLTQGADFAQSMQRFVDAYWEAFNHDKTDGRVSWVGFYLPDPENHTQMILAARRDKPACSPIGLHGACGQSFTSRQTLVVTDVANLGAGYIACDPRDRSELVVPLIGPRGVCLGVLDVDSFDTHAFTEHDARETHAALARMGLTTAEPVHVQVR